jgi:hypothetical protein
MKKTEEDYKEILHELEFNSSKKISDYETIKKRLSIVNKSMYRTTLVYDPLSLLEKSLITGRIFETKEPKPKKKLKNPPDKLTVLLKGHHNNKKEIQMYQLPKLPFGTHISYNEEIHFTKNHFKTDDCNEDLNKNLDILTRKFRLHDKNYSKRAKSSLASKRTQKSSDSQAFKMEAGYLVCKKEKEITEIYDQDKARYLKKKNFSELAKSYKFSESNKTVKQKKFDETGIIKRLYPTKEEIDNNVTKFYKSKYSALFSDTQSSTRPVTSFLADNKK